MVNKFVCAFIHDKPITNCDRIFNFITISMFLHLQRIQWYPRSLSEHWSSPVHDQLIRDISPCQIGQKQLKILLHLFNSHALNGAFSSLTKNISINFASTLRLFVLSVPVLPSYQSVSQKAFIQSLLTRESGWIYWQGILQPLSKIIDHTRAECHDFHPFHLILVLHNSDPVQRWVCGTEIIGSIFFEWRSCRGSILRTVISVNLLHLCLCLCCSIALNWASICGTFLVWKRCTKPHIVSLVQQMIWCPHYIPKMPVKGPTILARIELF